MQLPASLIAEGDRLIHLQSVDSTMEEARRQWGYGLTGRVWIVADEQRGGRGRHGRVWTSPPGNLYLTVVMPAPCASQDLPKLGFGAGVALQSAIGEGSRLKWPNDVLIDSAKVAGLLLEGLDAGTAIAIGMGVNIASHPEGTRYPATHLLEWNPDITREALFVRLSGALVEALDQFSGPGGFDAIRRRWLTHAAFLGQEISIKQEEEILTGLFKTIDQNGCLLLATPEGEIRIAAGDVFPLDK